MQVLILSGWNKLSLVVKGLLEYGESQSTDVLL